MGIVASVFCSYLPAYIPLHLHLCTTHYCHTHTRTLWENYRHRKKGYWTTHWHYAAPHASQLPAKTALLLRAAACRSARTRCRAVVLPLPFCPTERAPSLLPSVARDLLSSQAGMEEITVEGRFIGRTFRDAAAFAPPLPQCWDRCVTCGVVTFHLFDRLCCL